MSDSFDRLLQKCDLLIEQVGELHNDTTTIIITTWVAAGFVAIAIVIGALVATSGIN